MRKVIVLGKIGSFNGRPAVSFPKGWAHGWMAPNAKIIALPLTNSEWKEFRADYYLGLLACPFGYKLDDPVTPLAPWGTSIHGVPKLHPDDE